MSLIMDLECPICTELLYRIPQLSGSEPGYIMEILCQHFRMKDTMPILRNLGIDPSSTDTESFKKAKEQYVHALITEPHSPWAVNIMIGFLKVVATPCGHLFHFWCLKEWADHASRRGIPLAYPTCPYCRTVIPMHKWRSIKFGQLIDVPERDNLRRKLKTKDVYAVEAMKTVQKFQEYAAQLKSNQTTRMQKFRLWMTSFALKLSNDWKFNVSMNVSNKVQDLLTNPSTQKISDTNNYLTSKINEIKNLDQRRGFKECMIAFIACVSGFSWILHFYGGGREEVDVVKLLYFLGATLVILSFIGCYIFYGVAYDNSKEMKGIQGKLEHLKQLVNSIF